LTAARVIDATTLYAEAGVTCARIARMAARNGHPGCEFFAGIPGTLGGALAMNAGAWGGETWRVVRRVETVDRGGVEHVRSRADFQIGYRSVDRPREEWFVAAEIAMSAESDSGVDARIHALLAQRQATQPIGVPSCGSVFRNPPGDYAARLIEASGLKGVRSGGCRVSEKHANFIINDAGAGAADIEHLIDRVRSTVRRDHGVDLVTEVHIVGDPA
jgi:UDP-N-acetylmuramate dehydrogenase